MQRASHPHPRAGSAPDRILIDMVPAGGPHGQRGIGRYVRGLAASIELFPEDLRARVWAVGLEEADVAGFAGRAITAPRLASRGPIPGWVNGRIEAALWLRHIDPTAFHATDPHRPLVGRPRAAIVTAYDLIPLREPTLLASLRPDHRWVYRRYLRQVQAATRVIAISRTTATDLVECLGVAEERIDIVYPQVPAPVSMRREPSSEPAYLVVGALDPHKRPELALAAFVRLHARIGAGRLRYIGPADPEAAMSLMRAAHQQRVAHVVSIEGRIPDAALEEAYATATALLATSRIEGFGLPAVEAALRGVPVVIVDTEAARETVAEAATIVPDDVEAIAAALEQAAPPSPEAIAVIRDRFSPERSALALEACYRAVIG